MSYGMVDGEMPVNPAMITLARESRGLPQTELARRIGLSQAKLSNLEAGFSEPAEDILDRLSSALRYPKKFFCQTDPVFGPGVGEFFHRRRQDVPAKVLRQVHARINISYMHVSRLLRSADVPECHIKALEVEDFNGNPGEVARAIRAAWNLPGGPIKNVVKAIEDAGGIVIRFDFGSSRIDAISRYVPGLPPLFFVSARLTGDRERLTLCHELGHAVMHHQVPTPDMEAEANKFAAEFLMPARDIGPHLDHVNLQRLSAIKPHWGVSMAAGLYRAKELGKLSDRSARYLWAQMGERGFRRREPPALDLPKETPTLLQEVIDLHKNYLGYSVSELADLLLSDEKELLKTYALSLSPNEKKTQLRIVR